MEDPTHLKEKLDSAYQNSLDIAISLSKNKEYILKAPSNSKDNMLARYIDKEHKAFKNIYQKYADKSTTSLSPISLPRGKSSSHTSSKEKSLGKQLTGNLRLRSSLVAAEKEIRRIQAGGSHRESYLEKASPPLIQKIKQSEVSSPTAKLPNVSLVTGKTSPSLELPNFREYSLHNSTSQKPKLSHLDRIQAMNSALSNLHKELIGLEIFYNSNPGIPHTHDRRVLMKLYAHPHSQSNIIKKYVAKYGNGGTLLTEKSVKRPKATSSIGYYPKNPETAVLNCSANFKQSKTQQNSKLNMILQKLDQERPLMLKKKLQMIAADKSKFADPKLSIKKFSEFTKLADQERIERIRLAKSQVNIYSALLEYLKNRNDTPTASQLKFVEAIKDVLESGWPITLDIVKEIEKSVGNLESIRPLIEIIQRYLRK